MRRWCEEGRDSERENRRKLEVCIMVYVQINPDTAHMQTHPYTCTDMHTCTDTHTPAQTHPHTCTDALIPTYLHIHIDTPAHTDKPSPTHLHRHLLKQSLYCCEATSKRTKTHSKSNSGRSRVAVSAYQGVPYSSLITIST